MLLCGGAFRPCMSSGAGLPLSLVQDSPPWAYSSKGIFAFVSFTLKLNLLVLKFIFSPFYEVFMPPPFSYCS